MHAGVLRYQFVSVCVYMFLHAARVPRTPRDRAPVSAPARASPQKKKKKKKRKTVQIRKHDGRATAASARPGWLAR